MVRLRDIFRDPFRRFKFLVGCSIIVLATGNGYVLWYEQQEARVRCVQQRTRAIETGKALVKLVDAHTADGNPHAAEAWRSFRTASAANPPAHC